MKHIHHSTRARLLGFLMAYQGKEISTNQLRYDLRYEPATSWDVWAKKMGINPIRKIKTTNGHETLVFGVDELKQLLNNSSVSAASKSQESLPIQPTATPRHSLDQVLRDFNATTETLHQDVADRLQEIALHLAKQDQALRIIFKQQELLLKELGVAPPAIVN